MQSPSSTLHPLRSILYFPSSILTPHLIILALLLYFWATGLAHLDRFPKIHEDESWQAAPGYTFWAEGRFGTDLFAGFYGMEEHYYGFMPLFPLMVGAALHLFGMGLFQARLVPLMLTTLTLALTQRLGTKLFSPWHGTIAVTVLIGWRIAGPFTHLPSGIPLADLARIVRYDSAVPVFGLAALLLLISTLSRQTSSLPSTHHDTNPTSPEPPRSPAPLPPRSPAPSPPCPPTPLPFLLIGLLTALATLSHLYGAFWLPALLLPTLWLLGKRALKPILLAGAGYALTLLPWLLFVASGWSDFLNQYRNYANRFGLLDARFYLMNLLTEPERYDPIFNGAKQSLGAWLWLIAFSLSLGWLAYRAVFRGEWAARILVTTLAVLVTLFAFLLSFKTFNYLATLWPLFALVVAAGFVYAWQMRQSAWQMRRYARRMAQRPVWWRLLLALLFGLALVEGGLAQRRVHNLAQQTTPYRAYTRAIAANLPSHSRIMGLQHYWLGLADQSAAYRSILVPIYWTNPQYVSDPIPFSRAAQAIPPDVILLDQIMLDFLAEISPADNPLHPLGSEIQRYLEQQQAHLIAVFDDPTYGHIQIYRLKTNTP